MITTSYSSQQLLTLFGRRDAASSSLDKAPAQTATKAMVKLIEQTQKADAQLAQAVTGQGVGADLPIVPPEGYVIEPSEVVEARYRKAVEAMAKLEAREADFETENGFRRKVTPEYEAWHSSVVNGPAKPWGVKSHDEAMAFAERMVTSVAQQIVNSNIMTDQLTDPAIIRGRVETSGRTVPQVVAMIEDERRYGHLTSEAEAAVLTNTFEVTGGPLWGQQGDYRHLNNVEVRFGGKLVLTVEGHGEKVTTYDQAGKVSSVTSLAYQRLQPGSGPGPKAEPDPSWGWTDNPPKSATEW